MTGAWRAIAARWDTRWEEGARGRMLGKLGRNGRKKREREVLRRGEP